MTDRADASTGNGTVPASLDDGLDRHGNGRKPFKRIGLCLAGLVGGNSRSFGATMARILLRIDNLRPIMVRDIGDN